MGMTNFAQTMHDWQRMCKYYDEHYQDKCCHMCSIHDCGAIWEMDTATDWEAIEKSISAWAEKNPEKKYPSWREYLKKMGLIKERICNYTEYDKEYITLKEIPNAALLTEKADCPISAEIAAALGLEPRYE